MDARVAAVFSSLAAVLACSPFFSTNILLVSLRRAVVFKSEFWVVSSLEPVSASSALADASTVVVPA